MIILSTSVDRAAVEAKINEYLRGPGKGKLLAASQAKCSHEATYAGQCLRQILREQISESSSLLGPTAISAVSSISVSNPRQEGAGFTGIQGASGKFIGASLTRVTWSVDLNFNGDKHRPSVDQARYGGIDDIVQILNSGYSARRSIVGEWHGNEIHTLANRTGAHFVEWANLMFRSAYGSKYDPIVIRSKYLTG